MENYRIAYDNLTYMNPWLHKLAAKATGYDTHNAHSIDSIVEADELKKVQPISSIPMQESIRDSRYSSRYDATGKHARMRSQMLGKYIDVEI